MTMTGRGCGRGLFSSGRGRGGRHTRCRPQHKTESKKTLQDYAHCIGSAKQASDYNAVTKFLINHIRKTCTNGDDIANALEDGKALDVNTWKPTLAVSALDLATQPESIM